MEIQSNSYLKQLQILFSALFVGQALFAIILYFFIKIPVKESEGDTLSTITPLVIMAILVAGYFIFNSRIKTLPSITDLDERKLQYRSASIVKWAMFESTTILALVFFIMTGVNLFLYIGFASIVHFALHFPSYERVSRELQTDNLI
jgi:hypothetical protein